MISIVLLWYIGTLLQVPSWYYAVLTFAILLKLVQFGFSMYKAGMDH